jgi:hypothetical protein
MVFYSLSTGRSPYDRCFSLDEARWFDAIVKALCTGVQVSLDEQYALWKPLFERCINLDPDARRSMAEVRDILLELTGLITRGYWTIIRSSGNRRKQPSAV